MKLYTVKVEFDFVVAVEDGENPDKVAMEYVSDAFNDMSRDMLDFTVFDYEPGTVFGWDDRCIPYGSVNDLTTGELLSKEKQN